MTETTKLTVAVEGTREFDALMARLRRRGETDLERVEPAVREILAGVRSEGDRALARYVERFERRKPERFLVTDYGGKAALESLAAPLRESLVLAAERIRRFHVRQREGLFGFETQEDGVRLGTRVEPLRRVGVYAPGGKARYPSSVLMSALPAAVAGVSEIVVASPDTSAEVRAACHLAGVSAVLDAGGAQAIAALAYGTESVPRVDKIVGPGNVYVAAAKRLVFGEVGIDSIAGPSEILVIADETADAAVVAADLLSQAEHDEAAYALLVTTSKALAERVVEELESQLSTLPRSAIAGAAIRDHGAALVVANRQRLAEVASELAPEHVAVQTLEPGELVRAIRAAGAIFVGKQTPEAAGDYLAGPSHVLPTGGAARYASPLGVYDFVSRTSIIEYGVEALRAQGDAIATFARAEGLEAHARAVEVRTSSPKTQRSG
jgi:histidinol dehydrogenase